MKATCLFGASAALAILSFSHLEAPAQEVWVWDGGSSSDSKLSTAENWVSNIQPNTGNDVELQFTGSQRTSPANDFPFETAFWCWHLLPDAGTPFSISGGTVRLSAITNESPHLFTIKSSIHIPQHLQISLQGGDILLGGSEVTFQDSLRDLTVYGSPGGARTLTMGARLMDSASQARLVVNGNATVILTNANVYGDTVINSGRVQVGNGGACGVIGRGNVQVKNNSVLSFNRSDDLHLTTAITGNTAFQMTQDGTGETWLEGGGNNTWAGAVVNAGTLVLAKSSDSSIHALNSASLVKAGGTLRLGGEGNDQIADTATVTLEGGMFDLAGMHEVIAGLSGAGTVDTTQPEVACNFRVGYNSTSSTFSGQIRNSGVNSTLNLEKTGMGTFTLADFVSPFRGTVSVLQGTLALQNGASLPNVPSISLAANTRLKFTGASGIPVGQVVSGLGTIEGAPVIAGKLTPGNGIGVLRFSGTPNLQGTLEMEIRSDGATDKVISDSLLQYGGTLRVVNSGAAFSGGDSIDLFDAPSFGGGFSAASLPWLPEGLNWWQGRLTVSGALVVNRAPAVADFVVDRTPGLTVKIRAQSLAIAWTDEDAPDGDMVEFDSLAGSGSRGATVTVSGSGNQACIFYTPGADGDDTLTYRVRDARGGQAVGNLLIRMKAVASRVEDITMENGKPLLRLLGIPGFRYAVERSATSGFSSVSVVHEFTASSGVHLWRDETPLAGNAFYRMRTTN